MRGVWVCMSELSLAHYEYDTHTHTHTHHTHTCCAWASEKQRREGVVGRQGESVSVGLCVLVGWAYIHCALRMYPFTHTDVDQDVCVCARACARANLHAYSTYHASRNMPCAPEKDKTAGTNQTLAREHSTSPHTLSFFATSAPALSSMRTTSVFFARTAMWRQVFSSCGSRRCQGAGWRRHMRLRYMTHIMRA
jgi:hypothetical protein